jgi:hypothetical protein
VRAVDADGSGSLDVGELQEVVVLMGMADTQPNGEPIDMSAVMAQVDADGSGEVDLQE